MVVKSTNEQKLQGSQLEPKYKPKLKQSKHPQKVEQHQRDIPTFESLKHTILTKKE